MIARPDLVRSWPRSSWIPDWRLLVAAVMLIGVGGIAILLLPASYSAESAIAVRPDVEGVVDSESLELIAHEFVVYLGSPQTIDSVADDDDPDASVTASQDTQTATIRITVESGDRRHAVELANALAERAVRHGEEDDDARILTIADATEDGTDQGPPRSLYFGGLVLAAVLGVIAGHYALRGRRP